MQKEHNPKGNTQDNKQVLCSPGRKNRRKSQKKQPGNDISKQGAKRIGHQIIDVGGTEGKDLKKLYQKRKQKPKQNCSPEFKIPSEKSRQEKTKGNKHYNIEQIVDWICEKIKKRL